MALRGWADAFDPLTVDLGVDSGGGTTWQETVHYAGGSPLRKVELTPGQNLRYRLRFNLEPGQDLYESPVFDDITFTVFTRRPQILSWLVVY